MNWFFNIRFKIQLYGKIQNQIFQDAVKFIELNLLKDGVNLGVVFYGDCIN